MAPEQACILQGLCRPGRLGISPETDQSTGLCSRALAVVQQLKPVACILVSTNLARRTSGQEKIAHNQLPYGAGSGGCAVILYSVHVCACGHTLQMWTSLRPYARLLCCTLVGIGDWRRWDKARRKEKDTNPPKGQASCLWWEGGDEMHQRETQKRSAGQHGLMKNKTMETRLNCALQQNKKIQKTPKQNKKSTLP